MVRQMQHKASIDSDLEAGTMAVENYPAGWIMAANRKRNVELVEVHVEVNDRAERIAAAAKVRWSMPKKEFYSRVIIWLGSLDPAVVQMLLDVIDVGKQDRPDLARFLLTRIAEGQGRSLSAPDAEARAELTDESTGSVAPSAETADPPPVERPGLPPRPPRHEKHSQKPR